MSLGDDRAPRRCAWQGHSGIIVILGIYLALALTYSVTTPVLEASDEAFHFAFVQHLAQGGSLPVQDPANVGPWRQEGSQPPLYYWLAAQVTRLVDTSDWAQVHRLNPHADLGVVKPDGNANIIIHTARERFPWHGTVLAVHLVRGLSVLMGLVTVLATWLLGRILTDDPVVPLGAAALTGLNAQYLFVTSSVNNDALVTMLCALCLWLMARFVVRPPSLRGWVVLGVLIGMAALTKASALGIVALAGAAAVYVAVAERSAKRFWEAALGMAVPALLVCAWWFLRNWRLYRDPLGLNAFVAVAGARHPVPTLGQLLAEWPGFVKSYWGLFGALNVPLPDWAYVALSVMGGIGLIGVPLAVWRMHRRGALGNARWAQWGLVLAWPVVVAVALLRWSTMTMGSQGRLMFSALSALSLLMATGLSAYVPRCRGRVLLASAALLLIIAGLAPAHIIPPAYAQPAMLSEEEVLALSPRVDVTFGDNSIRLLSYHVDRDEATPGDQVAVTFYWQCLQQMDADYSVFLHLLDENDVIVAQRDMYPGQGTHPTSLWSPGEVFADTFVLALPATTHTPVTGQFAVGFYQYGEGSRLRVTSGAGVVLGDMLRFGSLTIPRRVVNGVPNPMQVDLEDGVRLVGYDLDRTAARPGETVHLRLYWQAIRPVSQNYSVFTHILGEENRLWAQSDGWPQGGNAPTKTWPEGQVIPDPYELTLYPDAPAGVWEVEIGMYDERGTRLKVLDPAGHVAGDRVVLAHVRVLPPE